MWSRRNNPFQPSADALLRRSYFSQENENKSQRSISQLYNILIRKAKPIDSPAPTHPSDSAPRYRPSSSNKICNAATATPTLASLPDSHAIQTFRPRYTPSSSPCCRRFGARWDETKSRDRGRTLCRKVCWPFFPESR